MFSWNSKNKTTCTCLDNLLGKEFLDLAKSADVSDLSVSVNELDQGCHSTGKTGNLEVHFSRQEKHREFAKNIKNMFLHREFTTNTGKIWSWKKIMSL